MQNNLKKNSFLVHFCVLKTNAHQLSQTDNGNPAFVSDGVKQPKGFKHKIGLRRHK